MDERTRNLFASIIEDATATLSEAQRRTTSMYLDVQVRDGGSYIGPPFQGIRAGQPCYVVFLDHHPNASFAHACHYRLYDAESRKFIAQEPARFPPYVDWVPRTYMAVPLSGRSGEGHGR